jgi:Rrf2 family protein
MKISTKGRYGLRILFDIAMNQAGAPRMMKDIASSQGISEKYISRLIIDLRKAGLVISVRGSKGGYKLARYPKDITLLEVVEVMEGRVNIVDCVGLPNVCEKVPVCAVRRVWSDLNDKIRRALGEVTLQDLVDNQRQGRRDGTLLEYCI